MAMTQTALVMLGALATLATIGMFYDFPDRWTGVLVGFAAAFMWGLFGMSSFDVIVRDTSFATASEPIMPLVYVGVAMAMITGLFAINDLVKGVAGDASDVDEMSLMGGR